MSNKNLTAVPYFFEQKRKSIKLLLFFIVNFLLLLLRYFDDFEFDRFILLVFRFNTLL